MRNPQRIHQICQQLEVLWDETPDWRFTQLLSNYNIVGDEKDKINFYQEDDETFRRIQLVYK